MATKIGDMAVYISANTSGLARDLKQASGYVASFGSAATRQLANLGGSIAGSVGSLLRDVTAVAGGNLLADGVRGFAGALGGVVVDSVRLAADMEKTQVAFEVMTGSAERARDLMKDIKDFAAESPLSLAETTTQVKKLLAAGVSKEQAVPTLSRLSDLSVGDPEILGRLSYAYGQVRAAGRLSASELRQFTETGIPLVEKLGDVMADALRKPKDLIDVKKLVEDGKVGFYELQMAIKGLTDEGGKFYGMTDKYAKTTAGKWERTKDAFDDLKRAFGTAIIEEVGLKEAAGDLEDFADNIKPLVESVRPLIHFVGNLAKGFGQLAAEGGRAFFESIDIVLLKLNKRFPETAKWLGDTVKNLKDFKLDPEGIANFAAKLGDGIADAIDWARPYWDSFIDDFVNPLRDAIMLIPNAIKSIRGGIQELRDTLSLAKDIGQLNVGKATQKVAEDRFVGKAEAQFGADIKSLRDKHGIGEVAAANLMIAQSDLRDFSSAENAAKIAMSGIKKLGLDNTGGAAAVQKKLDEATAGRIKAEAEIAKLTGSPEPDSVKALTAVLKGNRDAVTDRAADRMWSRAFGAVPMFKKEFVPEKPGLDPRLAELAGKLNDKFIDPVKKFQDDVTDLAKLRDLGKIAPDVHALALSDLMREAGKDFAGPPQLAAGVELGSQQLATMFARASVGQGPQTVESLLSAIKNFNEQQLAVARQIAAGVGAKPPVMKAPE